MGVKMVEKLTTLTATSVNVVVALLTSAFAEYFEHTDISAYSGIEPVRRTVVKPVAPQTVEHVSVYSSDAGIYYSTYGGLLQKPSVEEAAFNQLSRVLSYPYIQGVAHYQNWSTWEIANGTYNWTVMDRIFQAASDSRKSVILGLQMGVSAPEWLIGRDAAIVPTASFVHANPGWFGLSTVQRFVRGYHVSDMAVPWAGHSSANTTCTFQSYEWYVERAVTALAERYSKRNNLAYVNVCGPSASGGVEANFNVNYRASRLANIDYDTKMNYTLEKYVRTWQRRIDLYMRLFTRIGMAVHDKPGSQGYDAGYPDVSTSRRSSVVVSYTVQQQLAAARAIRDYMIAQYTAKHNGSMPIIRCCGGNNRTAQWGVPGTTRDKPPTFNYSLLMWEVRQRAIIGFEPGVVQLLQNVSSQGMQTMLDIDLYYNGQYLEIKRPDIINNTNFPEDRYVSSFQNTSARMTGPLPWNYSQRMGH
eukprot:m.333000 g.333000  ORF g.333000 m.333000 type:complete len:473 (-) comp20500_c0_seq1:371-1789(-)